jgi:single-strand DNA-binding protein
MRYTPTGKPVASFSVVTTHSWVASDGARHEETDWFNVIAWGDLAEESKSSLGKGQWVYVEGRIRTRRWQDASAQPNSRAEVVAQKVVSLQPNADPGEAVRTA